MIRGALNMIEREYQLLFVDRTSPYSPDGYRDYAARLTVGEYDAIQFTVSVKPDKIILSMGQYGMSATHLDTVRFIRLDRETSEFDIFSTIATMLNAGRE
jgi:hypothetical protein